MKGPSGPFSNGTAGLGLRPWSAGGLEIGTPRPLYLHTHVPKPSVPGQHAPQARRPTDISHATTSHSKQGP